MVQNYQDAMAIVRKFGTPDLFITFTCNPQWREIQESLFQNQMATDRPDLIARVFKMKLSELMKDITIRNIFGKCVAYIYVIEFQKRGLPHAHILLILHPNDRVTTTAHIDAIVTAEIPAEGHPLRNLVIQHMIHGPCGDLNPTSPCMIDNKCSKQYPKDYCNETIPNSNGYPIYKRRPFVLNEPEIRIRGKIIDNRWVVPYNPYLLKKYNSHINVEICTKDMIEQT
jgi:hypothetical protein